jgi:hypothetical protein
MRRPSGVRVLEFLFPNGIVRRSDGRAAKRVAAGACILLAGTLSVAQAESIIGMGGINDTNDHTARTYSWQIEYQQPLVNQQPLVPLFAASFSWLNEGHVPYHQRDGAVAQLWVGTPVWHDLRASLGVGPYLYFDTEATDSVRGYTDAHGVAGILTTSLEYELNRSWFVSLNASEIYAPRNVSTYTVLLGVGYRLTALDDLFQSLNIGTDNAPLEMSARQQVQAFGGKKIYNDLDPRQTDTFGADYRFSLTRWAAWSATWFNDPGSAPGLHDRVASQLWLVHGIDRAHLALSLGLGTYVQLGANAARTGTSRASGLSGIRADWEWAPHTSLVFTWYRRFTEDDEDRDILTLGLAWRFGEQ